MPQTQINFSVQMERNILDVVIAVAMGKAGMSFSERMRYGPEIVSSILDQINNEGTANVLFKIKI